MLQGCIAGTFRRAQVRPRCNGDNMTTTTTTPPLEEEPFIVMTSPWFQFLDHVLPIMGSIVRGHPLHVDAHLLHRAWTVPTHAIVAVPWRLWAASHYCRRHAAQLLHAPKDIALGDVPRRQRDPGAITTYDLNGATLCRAYRVPHPRAQEDRDNPIPASLSRVSDRALVSLGFHTLVAAPSTRRSTIKPC